ncbi:MAG: hypothetical protein KY475_09160 [Planctomycetes bacterium]|nr:hypothetical protein [Planctomycetota bacterium]
MRRGEPSPLNFKERIMISLAKEFTMNRSSLNSLGPDSRGVLLGVRSSAELIPCFFEVSRTRMPIQVPAQLLSEHRRSGLGDIVLTVAAEARPVRERAALPQQREANQWLAEMEDFDRF